MIDARLDAHVGEALARAASGLDRDEGNAFRAGQVLAPTVMCERAQDFASQMDF